MADLIQLLLPMGVLINSKYFSNNCVFPAMLSHLQMWKLTIVLGLTNELIYGGQIHQPIVLYTSKYNGHEVAAGNTVLE